MVSNRGCVMRGAMLCVGLVVGLLSTVLSAYAQYPAESQVKKDGTAVLLVDYANPPLSSATHAGADATVIDFKGQLGRITSVRSEPSSAPLAASRMFVDDQSGTIYIYDIKAKKFTPYLKFPRIFPKFESDTGNTAGIVSITFDPGYAKNGKFYTVHVERPDMAGFTSPTNAQMPSLNLTGYTTTEEVVPPAGAVHL